MKQIILTFALAFCTTGVNFAQDTLIVESNATGTFELVTIETISTEPEYEESSYTSEDGGSVKFFAVGGQNQRITNTVSEPLKLSIYPNPSKGVYTINSSSPISKVEVHSLIGEAIQTTEIKGASVTYVDISAYSKGIYFFKIYFTDGNINTVKVMLQ